MTPASCIRYPRVKAKNGGGVKILAALEIEKNILKLTKFQLALSFCADKGGLCTLHHS